MAGSYKPVLTAHVREPGAETLDFYRRHDGYKTAQKALCEMTPGDLIELVKKSGLRGRGGAGFSAGMKWGFVPKDSARPRYLVANADEGEPGTFKDRVLLERAPHMVIEGMILAAHAIGCHDAYLYIRGEFAHAARVFENAVREAEAHGFLGDRACGTNRALRITVHRGAGAYICGEETGLLTSLEGDRGHPKIKPPFPAVEGYFRSPTIVQNVETLAWLPHILRNGPDWFRQWGTEKSPGARLFCVSGHVKRPGVYEEPMSIGLRDLIYDRAGGILDDRGLKAVFPGGLSAPILTAKEIDVTMDFEAMAAAGTMGGSGGVIVIDEATCMVEVLWNLLRFYHHESCGQCTPCREGTGWLEKIAERLETGHGRPEDPGLLDEIARNMCGRTICVFADAAAMPARSLVAKFRAEIDEHVTRKGCPFAKELAVAHHQD